MLVKDYKGELIPKERARKIKGDDGEKYYEINVSCIKMPDGKWYRTTTGKIIYDHSTKKWVFSKSFDGIYGLLEDGSAGFYSDRTKEVKVHFKGKALLKTTRFNPVTRELTSIPNQAGSRWQCTSCINEDAAKKLGYVESIFDGLFYMKSDCNETELKNLNTPNIPAHERSNIYSLDDDKNYRIHLEDSYDNNNLKLERDLVAIARRYIPFSFGFEIEVQNGHIPARIREPLGFRTCRDGSLDGGIEFVSIPMEGAKGLQAAKLLCNEGLKRTIISNKCSVHIHFGDVRRDRLYVMSLWVTLMKLQDEFRLYFPYSRTNSIREDGKIYAALLPNINLKYEHLLKYTDDEEFKTALTAEWSKIYTYLNNGHPPGEVFDEEFVKATRSALIKGKIQKQFCYRVQKSNYTTKLPKHSIQGHKWQRPTRYMWVNFLNLFFAHSKTVEFRISEATFNFDKILILLLTYVAILKFAENYSITLSSQKITLRDVINDHFPEEVAKQIMDYWTVRKLKFTDGTTFKQNWKGIELEYATNDKTFHNKLNIE